MFHLDGGLGTRHHPYISDRETFGMSFTDDGESFEAIKIHDMFHDKFVH